MSTQFLWGALSVTCFIVGLHFLKFWRQSRERLFLSFALSFWVMGLSWVALAVLDVHDESRRYVYLARLVAFSLLLVGIIERNRRPR